MENYVKTVINNYMAKSIKSSKTQKEIKKERELIEHEAYHLWAAVIYKLFGTKCAVCNEPGADAHHIFPKGSYPHLKLDWNNGIMLCRKHHDAYHFARDKKVIEKIISSIGLDNYSLLLTKAKKITKVSQLLIEKQHKELKEKAEELGIL